MTSKFLLGTVSAAALALSAGSAQAWSFTNKLNLQQAGDNLATVAQSGLYNTANVSQTNTPGAAKNIVQGTQEDLGNTANITQNGVGGIRLTFMQDGLYNSLNVNQGRANNPAGTADNVLNVSQEGVSNAIDVQQFGRANYALSGSQFGALNSVTDRQNANFASVKFDQNGTSNSASFNQAQTPTTAVPSGSVAGNEYASIKQCGVKNTATINQSGGYAPITGPAGQWGYQAGGTGETAIISQDGLFNNATITQTAPGEYALASMKGNSNNVAITQQGYQEVASIIAQGSNNNLSVLQSGTNNNATVTVNGSFNRSNDVQTGNNNTIVKTIAGNFITNSIVQNGNNMSAVMTVTH